MYHYIRVSEQVATAGQPTEDQLRAAAEEGFTTVINLAPGQHLNALEDEAGLVQSLGMTYHHIPVAWNNPTQNDFDTFTHLLDALPEARILIHCVANFRVSAFYSLYALQRLGWSAEEAAAFRALIWEGSDYPIWEQFLARMTARLTS
jgi:uncharacterized protein (TIGR01244 family)